MLKIKSHMLIYIFISVVYNNVSLNISAERR